MFVVAGGHAAFLVELKALRRAGVGSQTIGELESAPRSERGFNSHSLLGRIAVSCGRIAHCSCFRPRARFSEF